MNLFRWTLIWGAALLCWRCGDAASPVETADMALVNGVIVTMDEAAPRAEALAVKNGLIVEVGDNAAIRARIGEGTEVIDLQGATAIPGFIEGHGHFLGLGIAKLNLDLMNVETWDAVTAMVAEAVKTAQPGEWIVGRGWHQDKFSPPPARTVEGYPLHDALSAVSPDNPVMLTHASGHALIANAKAMALAGVDGDTANPDGGKIVRDENGAAIGVFEETAESLIQRHYQQSLEAMSPEARQARARKALELAAADCLAKGVTSFQDAGSSFATIDLIKQAVDEGKLGVRLWVMTNEGNQALSERGADYKMKGYGGGFLSVGGVKRYMDGALGSRGAWLLKPYADLPESVGQPVMTPEQIRESAVIAKDLGLQLCTHAIGDRGNREVLDIYRDVIGDENLRWRIEHAQHLNPDDIPRFAQQNVIASMQGVHCTSDAPFVVKRLGERRAQEGAYVWRALRDTGAVVTNGTDAPVEDVDPIASYYAMTARIAKNGEAFFPEHKLTPLEALDSYTLSNAYAAFEEDVKGSLSPGKYADITVLSQDITTAASDKIPQTEVLYTIVGGVTRYKK